MRDICERFTEAPVSPASTVALILNVHPPAASHAVVEDAALGRLCSGYERASNATWEELLRQKVTPMPESYTAMHNASDSTDRIAKRMDRLILRHEYIAQLFSSLRAQEWSFSVLLQVETLKFAIDWSRKTGKGSKNEKTRFYKHLFLQQHDIAPLAKDKTARELDDLIETRFSESFTTWRRQHERVVTARNRLLQMYNVFGAGVLIDPVWNADRCRSQDFPAVLGELCRSMPCGEANQAAITYPLHRAAASVLLRMLKHLVSNETAEYVKAFIDHNPPSFCM